MEFVLITEHPSSWLTWKTMIEAAFHKETHQIFRAISSNHLELYCRQTTCGIMLWHVMKTELDSMMISQIRKFQSLGWIVVGLLSEAFEDLDEESLLTWIHIFDDCFKETQWDAAVVKTLLYQPRPVEVILESFRMKSLKSEQNHWERGLHGKRLSIAEQLKHSKVTVWGNPKFAYELAIFMADVLRLKTLVIDSDRIRPTADVYLKVNKHLSTRYDALTQTSRTGLNVMIDSLKKGVVNQLTIESCCPVVKGHTLLRVMTGCYAYKDFEYYTKEEFQNVIEYASKYHDIVIILVNEHLYDGFSAIARLASDFNIAAYTSHPTHIRQLSNLAHFLKDSQNMPLNRIAYVHYNDHSECETDQFSLNLLSQPFYLGRIKSTNEPFKSPGLFSRKRPRFGRHLEEQYFQLMGNWIKRRTAM